MDSVDAFHVGYRQTIVELIRLYKNKPDASIYDAVEHLLIEHNDYYKSITEDGIEICRAAMIFSAKFNNESTNDDEAQAWLTEMRNRRGEIK
jgi:hypothetical protein